jgi:galactose mutarotase-like enzyme
MTAATTLTNASGELEATFLPDLGMVFSSLRHRGDELLAQRGGPEAYADHGATFAIPLLHPWANRLSGWSYELHGHRVELDPAYAHRDPATGLPIHGVLAASPYWQVLEQSRGSLTAELDFGAHPEYLAAFPFPHRLRYSARLDGGSLTVSLTVRPSSDMPVPIAFGFHPYLTLPGSDRSGWVVRLPVAEQAILDSQQLPTGAGESLAPGALDGALGARTFDDSFERLIGERPAFSVADATRRIELRFDAGYPVAQVFAPEGSDFICFEPMTAPVNALVSGRGLWFAQPGTEFTAIFVLAVDQPV